MKKLISLAITTIALFQFCVATTVFSETIYSIDTASATDNEIDAMLDALHAEKINRIKAKLSNEVIAPDTDGLIMFRNIPWYSTREQAEKIIGVLSGSTSMGSLYRINYFDWKSSYYNSDKIDGELGCRPYYSGLSVAGYTPSDVYLCYMFPVVGGEIVRDNSIAQFYMGYYTFESNDFGDLSIVYSDLEAKLNALYGNGSYNPGEHHINTIWRDTEGNMIRLQINTANTWLTLAYVANDADAKIDVLAQAYIDEKTRAEDMLRLQNLNNVNGL